MKRLGTPHLRPETVGSTNDRARELAVGGAPHGTTVTTGEQTAGRGRHGRSWQAPAGQALLMSVVLRHAPNMLTLRVAVAIADACGDEAKIKWPNDILIAGRKVAGILCEQQPGESWTIVGLGVNVAVDLDDLDPELRKTAGTLGLEPDAIGDFRKQVLRALENAIEATPSQIIEQWSARDALRGQRIEWQGGAGTAAGVNRAGKLLVDVGASEPIELDSGEVSLVRGHR